MSHNAVLNVRPLCPTLAVPSQSTRRAPHFYRLRHVVKAFVSGCRGRLRSATAQGPSAWFGSVKIIRREGDAETDSSGVRGVGHEIYHLPESWPQPSQHESQAGSL